jgi:hypothetical protein
VERCIQKFGGDNRGKRQIWRPKSRWKIILKRIIKKQDGVGDWNYIIQDREKCLALLNRPMNIQIPLYAGNFVTR